MPYAPRLITLLFVAYTAGVSLYLFLHPHLNWDMLGYVGVIESQSSGNPAEIHNRVYGPLRQLADEETFEELTAGMDYRRQVHADPEAFFQQIAFYAIRPLYWGTAWALSGLGMDVFVATYAISNAAYALICLACFFYLWRRTQPLYALAGAVVLSLMPPLLELGAASTPDTTLALLVLLSFLLFVRDRVVVASLVLLAAAFVRSDVVFYNAILGGLLLFRDIPLGRKLAAIGLLALSAPAAYALHQHYGYYGWATIFHFNFAEMLPYPAETEVSVSVGAYLSALAGGTAELIRRKWFLITALSAVAYLALNGLRPWRLTALFELPRRLRAARPENVVLLAFPLYLVVRTLLFPASWPRFYLGQILVFYLCLLVVFYEAYGARLEGWLGRSAKTAA